MTAAVAAAPSLPAAHPRRWLAAGVMMVAALMDMIDVTIVNVALPTIRTDLGASASQLEWVVSAYMLAFASVLIVAGSFGDVFGRRRVFLLHRRVRRRQPLCRNRADADRADRRTRG
jgi:predicted MFS family arabinose efflux permease